MADVEINREESPKAAVGSDHHSSSVLNRHPATTSETYFRESANQSAESNCDEQSTPRGTENRNVPNNSAFPNVPPEMWASFFRGMAETFHNNENQTSNSKPPVKKMKPTEVYIPSFDPDDCEFTAAQWCAEIDHHRTQNSWTDYETRNAAFTHLRGRARKWASKSYPLCNTWDEAKERLTRQFASTKRFHDLFRDMVQYTSDRAASYVEYSTNKLAMIDRLETAWSEVNKIEVVISGISENQGNSQTVVTKIHRESTRWLMSMKSWTCSTSDVTSRSGWTRRQSSGAYLEDVRNMCVIKS
ncbi:uncharacterized protein LOC123705957 [Colias croceus]|uniref:uncharacterized protein LOC123705957 n=1 Tax=Colias crocea TaxID=72248 RepID=UPI001E27C077|nr:uncharacterized protein LOC123705957 [Colias croceus]